MVAPIVAALGRVALDLVRRNAATIVVGGAGIVGLTALATRAIANRRPFTDSLVSESLVFPSDLENYGISLSFQFAKYERRSIYKQPFERSLGKVRLPVPRQIVDRLGMNWDPTPNESTVGAALESTLHEATKTNVSIADSAKEIAGDTASGLTVQAARSGLEAANIPGLTVETALQPLGLAVNPFLTVLFKQPEFKTHSFSWTLTAKNPEEARIINAIIQTFRYHMLPDIAKKSGGTLLNYPDMVHIRFFNNDSFLYRFKPCVIKSVSVDYAPEGPSFFKGSSNIPAHIRFSIELLEIEYWVKGSFEQEMSIINSGSI